MRLLKSLTRGLSALDFLMAQREPARLIDVAGHLDVDKSNASHILRTLVASGYAEQTDGRRYAIAERFRPRKGHDLEEIIACREQLHPVLEKLVDDTRECAHMAVCVGTRVWYVDKIASPLPLKVDHAIGSLAPLHCTALGKAFLAFGSVSDTGSLDAYTERSITTDKDLKAEIAQIRAQGFACDDEEFTPGIRCAAVPVYAAPGDMIAAIGISGPTARIDKPRLAEMGHLLVEHSSNLDWRQE